MGGANPTNDDGVVVARQHFRDLTIEGGESILEDRCFGAHGGPLGPGISGDCQSVSSGEPVRETALRVAQQVHHEAAVLLNRRPGSGVLGDTDREPWWVTWR